jgi:thiol:disulfide interchange protein DsbC
MIRKLVVWCALVAVAAVARADEAAIRKAAEELLAEGARIEGIAKAGFLGLYEVRVATPEGARILYTDENGTYFFVGTVIDAKTKNDITEARLRKLNAVRFEDLPLAQAFKLVRGKGTRQLAYFSDPRCPYCRKFDQELTKVDDVTVHVFLIPIIARDSEAISKAVWCSPDRSKAWLELMLNGVQPTAKATCDTPIEKNLALSRKYGINGTPTLIFANGERVSGWMPADKLSKMLADAAKR